MIKIEWRRNTVGEKDDALSLKQFTSFQHTSTIEILSMRRSKETTMHMNNKKGCEIPPRPFLPAIQSLHSNSKSISIFTTNYQFNTSIICLYSHSSHSIARRIICLLSLTSHPPLGITKTADFDFSECLGTKLFERLDWAQALKRFEAVVPPQILRRDLTKALDKRSGKIFEKLNRGKDRENQ